MSTDWDAQYRAGETPWDKGAAAPPLVEWLVKPFGHFDGEVLVPGCGLGHDVRAIAANCPATQVIGLDVSASALAQARQFPTSNTETYIEADLFALPLELCGRFDWVFEHTCFCAIDPARRAEYVHAIAQALRPGGQMLAIFYLLPWERGEQRPPGGGPPFGTTKQELDALFAGHLELTEQWVPARAYPGREGRELVRRLRKGR